MRTLLAILAAGTLAAHMTKDSSDLLRNVMFQSSNFENILTWDGDNATDTVYNVKYKRYGTADWLQKESCQWITHKFCNLTAETSNTSESYFANVTAVSSGGHTVQVISQRFSPLFHTAVKLSEVTCIPKVNSIQMVISPPFIPIRKNGLQLTLDDMYDDLLHYLELSVNYTYKVARKLTLRQREYEFPGLAPNTGFNVTVTVIVPSLSKKSSPYVCRGRTLIDPAWTYSFSGTLLSLMGFLAALFCYVSYRYITKQTSPPNSLNIQRMLAFQPVCFIQEHILMPVSELSSPSSLAQPVQYTQVQNSEPKEPLGAPQLQQPSEVTYFGQLDNSSPQPARVSPHQTLSTLSYAPQAAMKTSPPSYTPQVASTAPLEGQPPSYTPQACPEVQSPSYTPQATVDSWPPSYGVCMENSGTDSPPATLCSPKHLRTNSQLLREAPADSCTPSDPSLQEVTSAVEELWEEKPSRRHLKKPTDPNLLHRGEPEPRSYLQDQLPLLSSVQIGGEPMSLPLQTDSLPGSPTDQGLRLWGLLDSLVCAKDEELISKTEVRSSDARDSETEPPAEVDALFRDLALTVQWES